MLIKKYKVWALLGITLLLAYFAPPKDVALTHANSEELGSSLRAVQINKNKNERPANQIEVLDLLARVEALDSEKDLPVFSKAYSPPAIVDISQNNKSANEQLNSDNIPVEKTRVEAPPLPFKMLGKYMDSGNQVFFVKHKNKNLVLHVGDVFLGKYKLDAVDAKSLTFIYLPLNIKQTLNLVN